MLEVWRLPLKSYNQWGQPVTPVWLHMVTVLTRQDAADACRVAALDPCTLGIKIVPNRPSEEPEVYIDPTETPP